MVWTAESNASLNSSGRSPRSKRTQSSARKVFLFPRTFRALMKRVTGNLIVDVEREEEQYLEKIQRESLKGGDVTLF